MDNDVASEAIADHEVIAQWYRAKAYDLRRLAWRRLRDWDAAEEVVQETFARALAQPRLRCDDPLWPWLATVAHRLCLDRIEQRKRRPTTALDDAALIEATTGDPVIELERRDDTEMMAQALACLPAAHRRVLHHAHLEDQSYAAIAALEARTVPWVKTVVMRARQRLRSEVERLRGGAAAFLLWPLLMIRRLRLPGAGQAGAGVQVGLAAATAAMVAGTVALSGVVPHARPSPHAPPAAIAGATQAVASPEPGATTSDVPPADDGPVTSEVFEPDRASDAAVVDGAVEPEGSDEVDSASHKTGRRVVKPPVPAVPEVPADEPDPDVAVGISVPDLMVGEPTEAPSPTVAEPELGHGRDLLATVTW